MANEIKMKLRADGWVDRQDWRFRRFKYAYRAPLVFDCRFRGAGEQIAQGRYRAFLSRFLSTAKMLRDKGRLECELEDLPKRDYALLQEFRASDWDTTRMSVGLHRARVEICQEVATETGREITAAEIRRMGIGDQCVLIGALQAIERDLGERVTVWYDPLYPASAALFSMSGLDALPAMPGRDLREHVPGEATIVDLRRHILEHPLQDGVPCWYGEEHGSPLAQFLWNLGWEDRIPEHRVADVRLAPGEAAKQIAGKMTWGTSYVTCQPLELTRSNKGVTPRMYSVALQMGEHPRPVMLGCGRGDKPAMETFVADMRLPGGFKSEIACERLPVWLAMIMEGDRHYTGNSAGMWLGFAARVPMIIMSPRLPDHGTMWEPKRSWFSEEQWKRTDIIT